MALWQHYLIPTTVEEALKALEETPGRAAVIAQGRHPPVESLIDLSQIEEMCRVDLSGEWVLVGAAVPLARLIEHPLIDQHAPCLLEACSLIGGPQVRNVAQRWAATLGMRSRQRMAPSLCLAWGPRPSWPPWKGGAGSHWNPYLRARESRPSIVGVKSSCDSGFRLAARERGRPLSVS